MTWSQKTPERWVRSDGAVVKYDSSSPWPNPAKPGARMYTAWEPDPSDKALSMERGKERLWGRPRFPRRWKTAEKAMAAVDREFPVNRK